MKIAMRIELIDTTSLIATEPASQSGGVRGWVSAPKIRRTICCSAMEMPKVASSVSSGR
jgi:hypothetical protein